MFLGPYLSLVNQSLSVDSWIVLPSCIIILYLPHFFLILLIKYKNTTGACGEGEH